MLSNYVTDISSLNNYSINVYINQNEDILCNKNERKIDKEKENKKTEDIIKDINSQNDSLIDNDELLENLLFNLTIKNYENESKCTSISPQVYRDLGIYESVLNKININFTKAGKSYLIHQLFNPTDNISQLIHKQNLIKIILNDKQLLLFLTQKLKDYKKHENELISIWTPLSIEAKKLYANVYFETKYVNKLNNYNLPLHSLNFYYIFFLPIMTFLSPILTIIAPFITIHSLFGANLSIRQIIPFIKLILKNVLTVKMIVTIVISLICSLYVFVQNMYVVYKNAKNNYYICKMLHKKVHSIYKITKIIREINSKISIFPNINLNTDLFNTINLKSNEDKFSLKSDFGEILYSYQEIYKNKKELIQILTHLGEIDHYVSMARLCENENVCFPNYIYREKPFLEMKEIWHPLIENSIKNNINIGGDNPNNICLTGPNAGGKSIFIKTSCISVIFAQTLGISFSKSMVLTPFSFIDTILNIKDNVGKESLFEAQVNRYMKFINAQKSFNTNQFTFCIMDELFTATNYKEGVAGAYILTEDTIQIPNNISIITTHFELLTKLAKKNKQKIKNMKMAYENNNYTYKLTDGTYVNHFIATNILKETGINQSLVKGIENLSNSIKIKIKAR